MDTGLIETYAKYATIGVGAIMVGMTLVSVMLMDRAGRRTLHLYGLGGMFIFSIFITISMLIKVSFRIQLICSKFMGNFTTSDISPNANMLIHYTYIVMFLIKVFMVHSQVRRASGKCLRCSHYFVWNDIYEYKNHKKILKDVCRQ